MRKLILFTTILISFNTFAQKKELTIALGNFKPYFIEETQSGIFTDLIKEVFKSIPEYELNFLFNVPNYRLWELFKSGQIAGAANVIPQIKVEGCKTVPMFFFSDAAVTLKKNKLKINSIKDLKNKDIVTFQGAKSYFGNELRNIVEGNKKYMEVPVPNLQAQILLSDRAEVSLGDKYIFMYEAKLLAKSTRKKMKFEFHEIFPVLHSAMAFKDKSICPKVNAAYDKIIKSGRFEEILEKYKSKMQ